MSRDAMPGPTGQAALAVLVVLGAALAAVHVLHYTYLAGAGTIVLSVHVALPLLLGVGLPWLGLVVLRTVEADHHPVVLAWTAVGMTTLGAVGGWVLVHVVHHGGDARHVGFLLANAGTLGATTGLLVGSYDAQRRTSTQRAREQTRRTEEIAEIVSHDLRNTLNLAQGYVDLAGKTGDLDRLARAERAHERMETIIDELLVVSDNRSARGRARDVDVATVAQEAWEEVEASGTLSVSVDGSVRADRERLRQLFEHAFRHVGTHADGPLEATVRSIDDGVRVEFAADVPLEVLETHAPREGGFELYLVASIADAHGWTVGTSSPAAGVALDLHWDGSDAVGGDTPGPDAPLDRTELQDALLADTSPGDPEDDSDAEQPVGEG